MDGHPGTPLYQAPGTEHGLGVALDECLNALLLEGSTVEATLARWPGLRDELEPLLRFATILARTGREKGRTTGQGTDDAPRRHVVQIERARSLSQSESLVDRSTLN